MAAKQQPLPDFLFCRATSHLLAEEFLTERHTNHDQLDKISTDKK